MDEKRVHYVQKENDVKTRRAIIKNHRIMNHKKIEQMEYACKKARRLNTETRKII